MSTVLLVGILIVMVVLIALLVVSKGSRVGFRDRKAMVAGLMIPVLVFLVWLSVILFASGSTVREM